MEAMRAVEKRQPKETSLQRLARRSGDAASAFARLGVMAALLTPVLLGAILTLDIPLRAFDWIFGAAIAVRPSNWLTHGGFLMGFGPFLAILFARRFGGEEASRAVTAAWGLAAIAVLAELSYLAPVLGESDLPGMRFTVVFVAAAMAAQYMAANIYDVTRGGGRWWRAPLYGGLAAALSYAFIYFPGLYLGAGVPWFSWMVGDIAIKTVCAVGFLAVYGMLRRYLRPRGGYGGR